MGHELAGASRVRCRILRWPPRAPRSPSRAGSPRNDGSRPGLAGGSRRIAPPVSMEPAPHVSVPHRVRVDAVRGLAVSTFRVTPSVVWQHRVAPGSRAGAGVRTDCRGSGAQLPGVTQLRQQCGGSWLDGQQVAHRAADMRLISPRRLGHHRDLQCGVQTRVSDGPRGLHDHQSRRQFLDTGAGHA